MKAVLIAVLFAALASGVITSLGVGGGAEKYLRYFSALLLTLAILSPLSALLHKEFSFAVLFPQGENVIVEQVPKDYLRQFEMEVEKAVLSLLEREFSLSAGDCLPIATAQNVKGVPVLLRLELRLYTLRGAFLTGKLRACLEQACGCEVLIREEIGE